LILRAAREVRPEVSTIWTIAQQVANNPIHIALLDTTNHIAGEILASAKGIVAATAAMGGHAAHCPGCPGCVLDTEGSGDAVRGPGPFPACDRQRARDDRRTGHPVQGSG